MKLSLLNLIFFLFCSFVYADITLDGYKVDSVQTLDVVGDCPLSTSSIGSARICFDQALGKLQCSEDGGAYSDCVGGGGSGTPGGSNKQVQYNSSGSFAGSSEFVFDGTNVGIGTTVPSAKLDVNGTVKAVSFQSQSSTAGNIGLSEASANGTSKVTISAPASLTADRTCTLEDDSTPFDSCISATGGGFFVAGSDGVSINTTFNVGIATTNPTAKLEVTQTAAQDAFRVNDQASDTMPFIIDSTGNVGIGTAIPAQQLTIDSGTAGNLPIIQLSALNIGSRIGRASASYFGSAVNDMGMTSGVGKLWLGSTTTPTTIDANGNVGIGTHNLNGMFEVVKVSTRPMFKLSSAAGAAGDYMIVGSSGNVGIGTINPVAKLEVTQTAAQDAFRVNDQANDTTPFIIDSTGNVGIGTTLPTNRFVIDQNYVQFDANGRMKLARNTTTTAATAQIDFSNSVGFSSASTVYGIAGEVSNSSTGNVIGYNSTAGSSVTGTVSELRGIAAGVRTLAAGTNVTTGSMIYANTPTITAGTIGTQRGIYIADQEVSGVTTGYGVYQEASDNDNYFAGNVGIGTFDVSGGRLLVTGGNVGIGTTTAQFTLDVNGSVRMGTGSGNVGIGSSNPGAGLDIGPGLTVRAVGIGTTVPQQLCRKADGTFGYFNGAWAGTCN